jgi:hypothetical protein
VPPTVPLPDNALPTPTDDTPTIISKQMPRALRPPGNGADVRGRRLAHFELIEPIGVGGMAAVLRARDTHLDRQVALKILPPEMAKDPENVQRFHQEARSAARLDHENIARVFFCGEDQTLHFIAFEFVEGENLRTILERRGRLPVEEALHYVLQVAAGLAHAAQRGVVHRDIKPSNIIITPSGRAKLVDMGLARSLEPQHDLGLTQSGVTLGTFDYISPEQALEPRDVDVRSDIYSLGCTFYHMLTGHPPVPEGTAAKKLHHHQHVKPLDPRQYVPDLPYAVAAVLDRMMAKLPKNRYQTPEQLVHQLLLAGKKIGAVPDVPEGVLSVEMTLPKPPGTRPLLVAGLAALTVVILVGLLGKGEPGGNPFTAVIRPNSGRPTDAARPGPGTGPEAVEVAPAKDAGPGPGDKDKDRRRPKEVAFESTDGNVAELARWLADNKGADRMEVVLGHDLLMTTAGGGLVADAKEVIIRGKDRGRRPTLRLTYLATSGESRQAALTIRAETSTLSNLEVVVAGQGAAADMAGVHFQGGQNHLVEACEFVQVLPSFDREHRLASVVAEALGSRPNLRLEGCCFLGYGAEDRQDGPDGTPAVVWTDARKGGQDAVVRRGPVKVTAGNCAFGPHRAAFRLEGRGEEPLAVQHCSVLAYAAPSAVFALAAGASAALDVQDSLFSRLGGPRGSMDMMSEPERVALVRQANAGDALTYNDLRNRYHNFDDYWVTGEGETGWAAFQDKVSTDRKPRDESKELKGESPWKGDPLKLLEEQPVTAAFQVNPEAAGLAVNGSLVGAGRLLGVELPRPQARPAAPRELVVNPDGADDSANRRYKRLEQAVVAAEPGDVILVQHNGDLPVKPIALEKDNLDLTIRAADGFRPRLTLAGAVNRDASLFRLQAGRLRLEGLDFLLQPDQDEFESQAVVVIAGGGQCEFKDCLATLNPDRRKAALSLATLTAAAGAMHPDGQRPGIGLDHCVIRGDGDLVWDRAGRPANVRADNTLVALGGSLLNLESREEAGDKRPIELNLTRVTAYLGGYLIRLQVQAGRDLKGLPPVECRPDHCLFLPAVAERTLIHLDGPADRDELLQKKLTWEKKGPNAYGTFQSVFDQQTPDGMHTTPPGMGQDRWKQFTGEGTNSKYGVRLAAGPNADSPFTELTPGQFRPTDTGIKDFGADLASLGRLVPGAKEQE